MLRRRNTMRPFRADYAPPPERKPLQRTHLRTVLRLLTGSLGARYKAVRRCV